MEKSFSAEGLYSYHNQHLSLPNAPKIQIRRLSAHFARNSAIVVSEWGRNPYVKTRVNLEISDAPKEYEPVARYLHVSCKMHMTEPRYALQSALPARLPTLGKNLGSVIFLICK